MNNNTIIAIVLTAIIAGGIGYSVGMNSEGMETSNDAQDAIVMMKEQSASIKQMAEMMKSSGMVMQELGARYNDETMMSRGKDMQAVGDKYMQEDASATKSSDSMEKAMSN